MELQKEREVLPNINNFKSNRVNTKYETGKCILCKMYEKQKVKKINGKMEAGIKYM